jgi:hypothetical protein
MIKRANNTAKKRIKGVKIDMEKITQKLHRY